MLEALRDPMWQFVGAALAVAALIATFVVYALQRQRKAVTYDVLSRTHLLTVREELEGKLQVLYEGQPAKSLSVLVVKVWNSGNQPVLASDYERPISFCVGKAAQVLSADVTDVDPPGVSAGIHTSDNILALEPTLLNPGDSVTLKVLVKDAENTLCPDARIVGVRSIRRASPRNRHFALLSSAAMVLLALGFYLVLSNRPPTVPRPPTPPLAWIGIGVATTGYVMLVAALLGMRSVRVRLGRLRSGD